VLFDSERTEARRTEIERGKEQALTVLKALSDGSRLDILRLIARHEAEMHGKKIAAKLNLSASAVSRHLSQLRDAGLIEEHMHEDRTITYRLQQTVIERLPNMLFEYLWYTYTWARRHIRRITAPLFRGATATRVWFTGVIQPAAPGALP